MSEHLQALEDARSQLYDAFSAYENYELGTEWEANLPNFDVLTEAEINHLSITELMSLIEIASTQKDADQVLRRFAPRILEHCIDGYHRWGMPLDHILSVLNICNFTNLEQRQIEAFLRALWLHHLNDVSPTGTQSSADTLLDAISQLIDVQAFLDVWLDIVNTKATAHIASLIVYGKQKNAHVQSWLAQDHILQRIEAAFWDCGNSGYAAMFAKAAEYLRSESALIPA